MRNIKFRMFDEKYETWYKGLGPTMYLDASIALQGYVLQQCIGLQDKNGKDIYEGDYVNFSTDCTHPLGDKDIVEWKNQVVHYDDKLACYFFGYKHEFQMMDKIMPETLEVVGNMFDNPLLIEQ